LLTLHGNGGTERDFIWMGDVVNVVDEALVNSALVNDIYNLATGESTKIRDIAEVVVSVYNSLYGKEIDIYCSSMEKEPETLTPLHVDNSKLLNLIDYNFSTRFTEEARAIMELLDDG